MSRWAASLRLRRGDLAVADRSQPGQGIPDAGRFDDRCGRHSNRLGHYAVPADEVLPKARELAQRLADGPTWAIRWNLAVNKWLKQQANLIMDAGLAYEALTLTTQDSKEAVKARIEKRKPHFIRAK